MFARVERKALFALPDATLGFTEPIAAKTALLYPTAMYPFYNICDFQLIWQDNAIKDVDYVGRKVAS